MKKSGPLVIALALLLGGGAGVWVSQKLGDAEVPPAAVGDPYGQLSSESPTSPSAPKPTASAVPDRPQPAPPAPDEPTAPAQPAPKPKNPPAPARSEPSTSTAAPVARGQPVSAVLPPKTEEDDVRFSGPLPAHADGWYALGVAARQAGDHRKATKAFAQAAALNPSAANWRALADEQVALRRFNEATRAYDRAAAKYRAGGDDMTARALEHLAAPYRQALELRLVIPKAGSEEAQLAKFEPPRGVMLGIHVGPKGVIGDWGKAPRMTGNMRPFAVAFRYWKFTTSLDEAQIFPRRFARAARSNGMALHLALEPGMPLEQLSDPVIRRFALRAKAADLPIFVRFASEMNDPHNAWSNDPALYRRTFARVAEILHREAANVAMVWMPMPGDLDRIAEYYPGPQAVDWAGLSLYSVPFENGDVNQPRLNAHPLATVDGFYRRYAPRHPIQLSEYASSNRSGATPERDFSAYAAQQLREVYWGAWLKYPRLKNINWLDIDMHSGDSNGKVQQRRNDYRLFGNAAKWKAFSELQQQGAFFQSFQQSQCRRCGVNTARPWPLRVKGGQALEGAVWVQAAEPVQRIVVALDGYTVETGAHLPYRFRLRAAPGKHRLQAWVIGPQDRVLNETETVFVAQ